MPIFGGQLGFGGRGGSGGFGPVYGNGPSGRVIPQPSFLPQQSYGTPQGPSQLPFGPGGTPPFGGQMNSLRQQGPGAPMQQGGPFGLPGWLSNIMGGLQGSNNIWGNIGTGASGALGGLTGPSNNIWGNIGARSSNVLGGLGSPSTSFGAGGFSPFNNFNGNNILGGLTSPQQWFGGANGVGGIRLGMY